MKIQVTQEDITLGVPNCSDACPIARAYLRASGSDYVEVQDDRMWSGDREKRAVLPLEASRFITLFDLGSPVEPFEFDVEFEPTEEP